MTTALDITTTSLPDGTRLLKVTGEIDMSNNEVFAAAVADGVAAGAPLVVDLTAVHYLDSSALHSLFAHVDGIRVRTGPLLLPVLTVSGLAELATVEVVPVDGP